MEEILKQIIGSLLAIVLISHSVISTEFSFELDDKAEACFNEIVGAGVPATFEFQVVSGGNLDVNVVLEGQNSEVIYKKELVEYDRYQFTTNTSGEYMMCFSNKFSTFTHKVVYMSFVAGEEKPIIPETEHITGPLTFMESASEEIHKSLNAIIDTQTHYRLQEAHGRRYAEDLNERVLWWSLTQTFLILAISISQVLILRNFFSDPVSTKPYSIRVREPRYARL